MASPEIPKSMHSYMTHSVNAATSYDVPRKVIFPGEAIGLPPRSDNDHMINLEMLRFGPVTEIPIGNNRFVRIGSTIASSAHTLFSIPYDKWHEHWQSAIANPKVLGTRLVDYSDKNSSYVEQIDTETPIYIPLDFVNWIFLVEKNTDPSAEVPETLIPVDWFDLAGVTQADDISTAIASQPRLKELIDNPTNFEALVSEIYRNIEARNNVQIDMLTKIYNTYSLPRLNAALHQKLLELAATHPDVRNALAALGRFPEFKTKSTKHIGSYMAVGNDSKNNEDTGRGPQSHPNPHNRNIVLFDLDEIQDVTEVLIAELDTITGPKDGIVKLISKHILTIFEMRKPDASQDQSQAFHFGALKFEPIESIPHRYAAKLYDPYSYRMMRALEPLVMAQLRKHFESMPMVSVESFTHITDEDLLHQRMATGWEITIPNGSFSEGFEHLLNGFVHEWYTLKQELKSGWEVWNQTQDDAQLRATFDRISESYKDDPELLALINGKGIQLYFEKLMRMTKKIKPTEKQHLSWQAQGKISDRTYERVETFPSDDHAEEILAYIQEGVNSESRFDPKSKLNLLRVPGFGISSYRDNRGQLRIKISFMESEKGVAELFYGGDLLRVEGK